MLYAAFEKWITTSFQKKRRSFTQNLKKKLFCLRSFEENESFCLLIRFVKKDKANRAF